MRTVLIALTVCVSAAPVAAQLTTTYTGIQREGKREVPATAQYAVEKGRAVMIMTGLQSARLLFDAKAEVLHMVNDAEKTYFDITKGAANGDPTGVMAQMQKQLEQLPKEQRAMAEQAMKSAMGGGASKEATPVVYVWSKETKTIAGYLCTRVDGMRGEDKITEYCGSTSNDFTMSAAERETMLEMQGYLRNFGLSVRGGNDEMRAFQWDTGTDGYPVLTRCYKDGKVTLELQLASVSRKPVAAELFALPSDYKKMDMSSPMSR